MTLEEIVNSLKSAGQDYGQLFNNNPKYTAVASNVTKGLENLVPPQFTNTQDAKSQEYSKKLAEWALGNGMGMSGMALTFIGKNAANWNPVKAAEAEKMLNAGVDPAQVWKDHLIGRMPDKSLFSEIDDSGAKFNLNNAPLDAYGAQEMPIYDALNHNNLQKEYPDLESLSALHYPSEQYRGASFDPKDKVITFGHEAMNQGKSVSLHELQHAVQEKEGWTRGGSPGMFPDVSEKKKLLGDANILTRMYMHTGDIKSAKELFIKKIGREPEYFSESYALSGHHPDTFLKERDALLSPEENYQRLTGEAQARATQDRMNMGMQQRRDTYPLAGGKLSDIPLDQLINRYR
jgi:hypothetical protein